jgi:acetolactate synthase I/III small subunit
MGRDTTEEAAIDGLIQTATAGQVIRNSWLNARLADRHVISVLVDNEAGVLARVIGMVAARGYNIESLTVAEVDAARGISRINILTTGTRRIVEQIKLQIGRLIPVHEVRDLTEAGPLVARELALVKVMGVGAKQAVALRIGKLFNATTVDSTTQCLLFEVAGSSKHIDAFIELMRPMGLVEVSRTGLVAISRETDDLNSLAQLDPGNTQSEELR